jgi:hypothetical protein
VPPRNRKGYEEGQAVQAAVRRIMAAQPPLAAPLTAKAVNAKLPPHLRRSERGIQHHMQCIRRGFDSGGRNVSAESHSATYQPRAAPLFRDSEQI